MRVVVVWVLLSLGLAALAGSHTSTALHPQLGLWFCLLFGAATAAGTASSTALAALRRGQVRIEAGAPPWGVWRRALVPIVGGVAAAGGVFALNLHRDAPGMAVLWWSASAAVVVGRLLTRVPPVAAPVRRHRLRWLVEGAVPAALIAGSVGVVVGHVRFGAVDAVAPGALARTLAVTVLGYLMLGMAGFIKAFQEHKTGAVVVDGDAIDVPGPLLPGLVLAVALALAGPWVLPTLPGADVWIWKGLIGLVIGGGLSLLGALAGHRASTSPTPR